MIHVARNMPYIVSGVFDGFFVILSLCSGTLLLIVDGVWGVLRYNAMSGV